MLRIIAKIICILLLPSLTAFAQTTANETKSVNTFMQTFIQAYEKRELEALIQFYEPNAVVIGTGQDEVIQGSKQIMSAFKRDLDQHTSANITLTPIAVDVEKNVAFATYNLLVNVQLPNKKFFKSPLRLSVGLIKHGDTWLIMQSHLSAPLAGQDEGQAFPKS